MNRLLSILKALALGTIPVVGVCFCVLMVQVSAIAKRTSDDEGALAQSVAVLSHDADTAVVSANTAVQGVTKATASATLTINSADAVLRTVNRPCGGGKPCGTLADVAKTLNTVRGTFGQIEVAANHEDKNLSTLDKQEATLFADTHSTLSSADALIASPYITASLKNIDTSSAAIADSTKQADAILVDAREKVDQLAHPPKKKLTFWGVILAGVEAVHKLEPPIF